MTKLKRFSAQGYTNVIERRDCLFNPYQKPRSSYLCRNDLLAPRSDFSKDISTIIGEIKINDIEI